MREIAWGRVLRIGLIGAAVAVYFCLVGIVPAFHARMLIEGVISVGQSALVLALLGTGWAAVGAAPRGGLAAVIAAAVAGAIGGAGLTGLVIVGTAVDLRAIFLPASPAMYEIISYGQGVPGSALNIVFGAVIGAVAGTVRVAPVAVRRPLLTGSAAVLFMGLFSGILRNAMLTTPLQDLARLLFTSQGVTVVGAVLSFVIAAGTRELLYYSKARDRVRSMPRARRRTLSVPVFLLLAVVVIFLPQAMGPFVAHVIAVVAIYILLALGLNITLGLAGLLDLGFVAFLAVGAYTVGLLTSPLDGIAQWSFWAALPVAVIVSMLFGAFFGLPILNVRGDYLAIATLGFGEIIRILAGSDLLLPLLGGPQGITQIPKPIDVPPNSFLSGPNQIYYIALAFAAVVAFVALRLRKARIGRAWLSIREDEDVAEAVGVNLVQTKLLAYMLGAAFAGLGGGIFAGLVGSIFDSSVSYTVSINVVAIVVIGGMGSVPGAVLGAVFLIGLPELFREFADYRFLFYGAALMVIMVYRPEGLLPTRFAARELHAEGGGVEAAALAADPESS